MLRVLIAEDELALAYGLHRQLEQSGCQVVGIAADGKQAVGLCQTARPDVVLMDVGMPVMDGIKATRMIMQECPTCVLVLTAFHGREVTGEAEAAGAMGCLAKPTSAPELLRAATSALVRFAEFGVIRAESEGLDAALETRPIVEQAKRILAMRNHVDVAAAFQALRESAGKGGLSLRAMAEDIVNSYRQQSASVSDSAGST
jgi:AmiR/NasT family two-component response regulator